VFRRDERKPEAWLIAEPDRPAAAKIAQYGICGWVDEASPNRGADFLSDF